MEIAVAALAISAICFGILKGSAGDSSDRKKSDDKTCAVIEIKVKCADCKCEKK